MDETGACLLKVDSDLMLKFLGIEEEEPQIVDELLYLQGRPGEGITLVMKKDTDTAVEWDNSRIDVRDKNPYLHSLVVRCQLAYIEREMVVRPKINSSDQLYRKEEARN